MLINATQRYSHTGMVTTCMLIGVVYTQKVVIFSQGRHVNVTRFLCDDQHLWCIHKC